MSVTGRRADLGLELGTPIWEASVSSRVLTSKLNERPCDRQKSPVLLGEDGEIVTKNEVDNERCDSQGKTITQGKCLSSHTFQVQPLTWHR